MKRSRFITISWMLWLAIVIPTFAQDAPADRFFQSDGLRIRYIDEGSGEPVVLLHGLASSADDWLRAGVISTLNFAGFRTIAYDARGHGRSDKPHDSEQFGPPEVEDLVHLLDHLGIARAHLVGYSRGAMIAHSFMTLHPDRVRTVILGGYGYDGQNVGLLDAVNGSEVADAFARGDVEPFVRVLTPPGQPLPGPEAMSRLKQMLIGRNDAEAIAASMLGDGRLAGSTRDQLESNTIPILAIVGERDWVFRERFEKMAVVTGTFEALMIPGADHLAAFARPEFKTGIVGFLVRHSAD